MTSRRSGSLSVDVGSAAWQTDSSRLFVVVTFTVAVTVTVTVIIAVTVLRKINPQHIERIERIATFSLEEF